MPLFKFGLPSPKSKEEMVDDDGYDVDGDAELGLSACTLKLGELRDGFANVRSLWA